MRVWKPLLAVLWLVVASPPGAAAAPADVSFDGGVTFGSGGVVELEIAGPVPGAEHDRIQVADTAGLDGTLALLASGSFGTTPGAQVTLITWASQSGEFATVSGVQQPSGIDLAVGYGGLGLTVQTRRRGDVDGDGAVTPADRALVEGNLGLATTAYGAGDLNGDGVVEDDGLVNQGTLHLTNAAVNGDVRSPAGSTLHVAGTVVFNGQVSGAGSFSGTTTQMIFNGGYAPGD